MDGNNILVPVIAVVSIIVVVVVVVITVMILVIVKVCHRRKSAICTFCSCFICFN